MQCQLPFAEQQIPTQKLRKPAFRLEASLPPSPPWPQKAERLLATFLAPTEVPAQPLPGLSAYVLKHSGSLCKENFPHNSLCADD